MSLAVLFLTLSWLLIAIIATFLRDSLPLHGASRRSPTRGNAPVYASVAWFGAVFFGIGTALSACASTRTTIEKRRDSAEESMG